MRQFVGLGLVVFACGWMGNARAECTGTYTGDQLVEDLGQMTVALRALDEERFQSAGLRLEGNLTCAKQKIPVGVFASAFRFIGAYHYLSGRDEVARAWFRSSLELDGDFQWDITELDLEHPMRRTFDEERAVATAAGEPLEGMVINPPSGSTLLLDGRSFTEPLMTGDRPHVLQVIGDDQSIRQVFVIEDGQIPEQFLLSESMLKARQEAASAASSEKKKKKKNKKKDKKKDTEAPEESAVETSSAASSDNEYDVVRVERTKSGSKIPMLAGGGAALIASGVLYGLSSASHKNFDTVDTTDDLNAARNMTNQLVMASGVSLVAAVGMGSIGLALGGEGAMMWHYQIGF